MVFAFLATPDGLVDGVRLLRVKAGRAAKRLLAATVDCVDCLLVVAVDTPEDSTLVTID